ncbi:MAG: hypothetical protein K0M67_01535 [Thiobacillus sp.]|jgi:hypothetical protein|nr:hypothetical protein [Thiobacillus sp.]
MSTKQSIKSQDQTDDAPGFHLWEDCFETMDNAETAPVYLRFEGVSVELETQRAGATVTVTLPRDLARALGIVE